MYQYSSSTHPQFVGAHPPYTYPMYTSQGCNVPVYSQSDSSTSLSSMYTSSPTKAQNSGHSGRHRDEVTSPAISCRRICRHFAAGKCTWGSACRFSHNMTLPMTIPSDVKTNANCINTACDIQNSIVPFTTHGARYNQATPENLNAPNPSINVAKDSAPQNRDVEITPQSIYNPLPHLNFSSTPSRYEMTPPSLASTFSPNYSYGYNPYALSEAETSFSEDYHVPVNMAHHKSSSGSHEGGGFGQQFNIQHSRAPNSDNSEDSSNSTSIRVWQHQPYGDLTSASPCRAVTSHQINMIDPPPFRGPDGVSHTYPP